MKSFILLSFVCWWALPSSFAQTDYQPAWAKTKPSRVVRLTEATGGALVQAVEKLKPGDKLEIPTGKYTVDRLWDVQVSGTADAPIWIVAAENAQVVITRSDSKQNVMNVGADRQVSYLCIAGLELTGGSHGLRLGRCQDIWVDRCHIHHTADVCLSANSAATERLYLTSNHLHHGSGHGEGMYLGAHDGKFGMSQSVIALNHVHDCGGSQGDGIEVKQGSWGNLIAENHIHDTHYPCITVYGTGGKAVNTIERNLCYRSGDHVIQVQGEAVVRNNILIAGQGAGFASTDHQARTINLQVLHNTIINTGHAFSGSSWNGREGLIVANNVLYSRDGNALNFANGFTGVTIRGNVVMGQGNKHGSPIGRGLEDFVQVTWDAQSQDVAPADSAQLEQAASDYLVPTDFYGKPRKRPISGAVAK